MQTPGGQPGISETSGIRAFGHSGIQSNMAPGKRRNSQAGVVNNDNTK